jgi:transposase
MRDHECFLIRSGLRHLICLQEKTEEMDAEILRRTQTPPFREAFLLLQTIPGIASWLPQASWQRPAPIYPLFRQLRRWQAGRDSAREIERASEQGRGARLERATHTYARPWSSLRGLPLEKVGPLFQLRFRDLAPRRGPKRAIVAIVHQMLTVLYFMRRSSTPFHGADTMPQKHRRLRRAHHHLRCLRRLGLTVEVFGSLEDAPSTG